MKTAARRTLAGHEKEALTAYIPEVDLREARLHEGRVPWYLPRRYAAVTRGCRIYFRPGACRTDTVEGLALLAHELVHVGQYRQGATWLTFIISYLRHGYWNSPLEAAARETADRVRRDHPLGTKRSDPAHTCWCLRDSDRGQRDNSDPGHDKGGTTVSTTSPALREHHDSRATGTVGELPGGRVPRALLVPLRIYLGLVFLLAAWPKLTAEGSFQPRLEGFLRNVALESAHGFYRGFLESVVLPNAALFTPLIVYGELLVALALLAGIATRLAAGIAMFFLLNYMLAKGMWLWTPASNDAAMFFIALVLMLGAAGRSFGADRLLHDRYPTAPLW